MPLDRTILFGLVTNEYLESRRPLGPA